MPSPAAIAETDPREASPSAPPAGPAATPGLSGTAARGFAWMTAQTLLAKVVTLAGQVVLAWLLVPESFGLIGMAYTVMGFASVIQQGGLRQVLVNRQKRFHLWANPGFWLGLSLGVFAALVMVAAGPLVAIAYDEPRVFGLVALLALSMPIDSLGIVPTARLQSQLRFRLLAVIGWLNGVGQMAVTIAFAWLGFEAYSFAIGRIAAVALTTALVWWAAWGLPIRRRRQTERWRFLISDSALLFAAALLFCAVHQGGSIVLGVIAGSAVVGVYYFAYNLSLQSIQVITLNLEQVLFPTLSKLQDDVPRQTQAFLRATTALSAVAMPLCMLQGALAEPVIRLVFEDKWLPAIPVVQALSIGMAISASTAPASSLMLAQRRFRVYLYIAIAACLLFFVIVSAGAVWQGATGAAIGAAIYYFLIGVGCFLIAVVPGGGGVQDLWRCVMRPFVIAAAAIGVPFAATLGMSDSAVAQIGRAAIVGTSGLLLYAAAVRLLMPAAWGELANRVGPLIRKLARRGVQCDARCAGDGHA